MNTADFCYLCERKHFTMTGILVFKGDCGCICHKTIGGRSTNE